MSSLFLFIIIKIVHYLKCWKCMFLWQIQHVFFHQLKLGQFYWVEQGSVTRRNVEEKLHLTKTVTVYNVKNVQLLWQVCDLHLQSPLKESLIVENFLQKIKRYAYHQPSGYTRKNIRNATRCWIGLRLRKASKSLPRLWVMIEMEAC